MKKLNLVYVFWVACLLLLTPLAYGQVSIDFKAQGNQDEVKLMWAPLSWPGNLDGFNIKRKTPNTDWEKLNEQLLQPGTANDEQFYSVTNDASESQRLLAKRDSLIDAGSIRSLNYDVLRSEFLLNTDGVKFMAFTAFYQFDYALMHGFGYYDRDINGSGNYIYGIFPVVSGNETREPIKTYEWTYGSSPQLNLEFDSEIKNLGRKKGLQVTWILDVASTIEQNIKAFHIYQRDSLGTVTKLTETPKRLNTNSDKSPIFWIDKQYDLSTKSTFYLVPIDLFDNRGSSMEIQYEPGNYTVLEAPTIGEISLRDNQPYFEWSYDRLMESQIKWFEIYRYSEKNKTPQKIGQILRSERAYVDENTLSGGYYYYQVLAISKEEARLGSLIKTVFIMESSSVSPPKGLRANIVDEDDLRYILLEWSEPAQLNIDGYRLYSEGIMGEALAYEGSIPLITERYFKYPVDDEYGKKYQFAISAFSDEHGESELSESIEVFVPSEFLPDVNIWPIEKRDQVVVLNWQYLEDIEDLTGFRLFQNNQLILDETQLDKTARKWQSEPLEPGSYTFEIEAVTQFGVVSNRSKPRKFNIQNNP